MPRLFIYPENEVMFRVVHNGGAASFHDSEPALVPSIRLLVRQGWLVQEGMPYPCAGRTYTRYMLGTVESLASLKARL